MCLSSRENYVYQPDIWRLHTHRRVVGNACIAEPMLFHEPMNFYTTDVIHVLLRVCRKMHTFQKDLCDTDPWFRTPISKLQSPARAVKHSVAHLTVMHVICQTAKQPNNYIRLNEWGIFNCTQGINHSWNVNSCFRLV